MIPCLDTGLNCLWCCLQVPAKVGSLLSLAALRDPVAKMNKSKLGRCVPQHHPVNGASVSIQSSLLSLG